MKRLDTSILYCKDSLGRLSELRNDLLKLSYLDPPFFSNRVYAVIWGDEAEMCPFYVGWMHGRSSPSSAGFVDLRRAR